MPIVRDYTGTRYDIDYDTVIPSWLLGHTDNRVIYNFKDTITHPKEAVDWLRKTFGKDSLRAFKASKHITKEGDKAEWIISVMFEQPKHEPLSVGDVFIAPIHPVDASVVYSVIKIAGLPFLPFSDLYSAVRESFDLTLIRWENDSDAVNVEDILFEIDPEYDEFSGTAVIVLRGTVNIPKEHRKDLLVDLYLLEYGNKDTASEDKLSQEDFSGGIFRFEMVNNAAYYLYCSNCKMLNDDAYLCH